MKELVDEIISKVSKIGSRDLRMPRRRPARAYSGLEELLAEELCECLEPYFDRLRVLFRDKDDANALILCQAIIKAMHQIQESGDFELVDQYASEYPEETADFAACLWRTAGDVRMAAQRQFTLNRDIPADFVREQVPNWNWLLHPNSLS